MNAEILTNIYAQRHDSADAMAPHMPTLRALAAECDVCVEFGVRRANSTAALLMGLCDRGGGILHSVDLEYLPKHAPIHDELERGAEGAWVRHTMSSLEFPPVECDLLLHDSLHSGPHVLAELRRHADHVRRYLVFHDTESCGEHGQDPQTGKQADPGLPQIPGMKEGLDTFLAEHPEWKVVQHYVHSNGLTIMGRA